MDDTISRAEALDALTKYWEGISDRHPTLDGEMAVYADCKGVIKRLPSAQSELVRKIYAIGNTGKEGRIYIGGRLFAVRELAQ